MEFLVEAELIHRVEGKGPVIDLSGANLRETELGLIALRDIFPSDVHINLSGAKGISNQKLFRKAKTLEGASMPTGQTYEDWLKGRGPD